MFAEPTYDDGHLRVVFEGLEHGGSRRSERKCALVDQQGVLFVDMRICLTKTDSIFCEHDECFMISVVILLNSRHLRHRTEW